MWANVVGDSQNGVCVTYDYCVGGAALPILKINLMGQGLTPPCCEYVLGVSPPDAFVREFDCDGTEYVAGGFESRFGCLCIVATEQTTWGVLKSLYAGD